MNPLSTFSHSVTLDVDKCKGCTTCIRHCPTEAIRVRGGKAKIITERCIDCGECILVCPHHAKQAVFDRFEDHKDRFAYKVALPAPSLYGQFNNLDDIDYVLTGLLRFGFDAVFEVASAAEIISDYTRRLLATGGLQTPIISSACPAVVRLIRARFPHLCDHVLPIQAPVHLAASLARAQAVEKTGLKPEQIGIFFLSPCPAKVTDIKSPVGLDKSEVDCVLAINDVYKNLLKEMNRLQDTEPLATTGIMGIGWASSGGESSALLKEKYLATDGIDHVMQVLEELEDEKLTDLEFIELNACTGGCVGGAFTVENPFVAKARIQMLRKYLPISRNKFTEQAAMATTIDWRHSLDYQPVLPLDDDLMAAMEKLQQIERMTRDFPGLDCGACGAPSCRALAEDIARGQASASDCLFILKQKLDRLFADVCGNALSTNNPGAISQKEESSDERT